MFFDKKRKSQFAITDNRRTIFFVSVFVLSMLSMVILYPKTMISFKNTLVVALLFLFIDIVVLEMKTKIRNIQTYVGLCITIIIAQLSILLWLNFIYIDSHVEKYKIVGTTPFDRGELLQLENDAYKDFFLIRYQSIDTKVQDSVSYYFKDGLLGFKILEKVK